MVWFCVNEWYPVVTIEVENLGLGKHPVDLELAKQVVVSSQVQIFHEIRLEVIEIAVKVHLNRLFRIFWRFEVNVRYLSQINVEGRFYPRFAHPALVLVSCVLI